MFTIAFTFGYGCFMAGMHWLYLSEILKDSQFGFVSTVHYSNGILIAMTTEYFVNGLGSAGTFLYYALMNLAGVGFI